MAARGPASPQLIELAGKIADGAPVDWVAEANSLDPELLARLKDVEALAGRCLLDEPLPTEPPAFETGSRFDRLQILERIGAGASGVVYRARDPVVGREVALKVCAPTAERRAALLREAQQMAKVDHPNVLRLYGAVEHGGVVGFWSDLVRGESLDAWARSRPPLSATEIAVIGLELCSALAAIHAQGLVHGDVKPGNVIRHASGRWVLLDFGSTSAMDGDLATSGTPLYLAPELLTGGRAGRETDIYALGVLLFRLASGHYPCEADDFAGLLEAHRCNRRKRLLDLRPDFDLTLVAALEKALETSPAERHRSAGEFAQALDASLPRRSASARQRWVGVTALLGAAALLGVLLLWSAERSPIEPRVVLQRVVDGIEQPLRDGDEVRPGDELALRYWNHSVAHVYVINEDANGESYQLFPLQDSALQNPLPADMDIRLPGQVDGQDSDWQVTSRGGQEHFYVIVSDRPLSALFDRALAQAGSTEAALQSRADLLATNGDSLRGTAGLKPRSVHNAPASGLSYRLEQLQRDQPGVYVQRIALRNP
jgi:serine/threonine protein kinase